MKRLAVIVLTAAGIVAGSQGAAVAGTPSASYTPDTSPDTSCLYGMSVHVGHRGSSWDGTADTSVGTVTFSTG